MRSCLLCLLLLMWPVQSSAGPITFQFEGEVTHVYDPNNRLGGQVQVVFNSAFAGEFTFDPLTSDSNPDPRHGEYQNAILDIHGTVGGLTFSRPIAGQGQIEVENWHYDWLYYTSLIAIGDETLDMIVGLYRDRGTAFSTDALPLTPPDFSDFNVAFFAIDDSTAPPGFPSLQIHGNLSTLVPEPGTISLLTIGAFCLLFRRRTTRSGA